MGPAEALEGLAPRLEALGAGTCHWPVGDPKAADFSFCGRPASRGPYCVVHGRRAYRGAQVLNRPAPGCEQTQTSGPDPVRGGGLAEDPEMLEGLAERVACSGPSSLGEAETLRWMLARPEPARPELAQVLLVRFGCVARVLGANVGELIPLVGVAAATELVVWRDVARRLLVYPLRQRDLLSSFRDVEAYLRLMLRGASREQFRVLFLDRSNRLLADELMGEGTVDHAPVYPREVARRALELAASALCLVHNHPSASSSPSRADIEMTQKVCDAAKALGLIVHDHFLVAGDKVISFRALGLM